MNPKTKRPMFDIKFLVLLYNYVFGFKIPESLKTDLSFMLTKTPSIVESMLNFIMKFPKSQPGRRSRYKFFGLRCVRQIVKAL